MDTPLSRVAVVLYQPQNVVNVAAIIRVMSNFGLTDLRLIEPAAFDPYRIEGIAHHAGHIVAATRRFQQLADAVVDCNFVLGTTGRPRKADRQVLSPRMGAPLLLQTAALTPDRKVAVLFGTEQDGLPNEALDLCHGILTIPTSPDNRSLNLAQAALVVAYELWTAHISADEQPPVERHPNLAGGPEREAMFDAVRDLLLALYPNTTESRLGNSLSRLRTMLMRAAPRTDEATALTNLCRHATRVLRRS